MISMILIVSIVGIVLHVIGYLIGKNSANNEVVKDIEGLTVRIEDALNKAKSN